jgi:hypothetical protein
MVFMIKNSVTVILILSLGFSHFTMASPLIATGKFKGNLVEVLGDTKQGFINKKIETSSHVDHLLKGFLTLGVTAIRIPIFAQGLTPNEKVYKLFITKAKEAGFKLYANPAITCGGVLIVNDIVEQNKNSFRAKIEPENPLDNDQMTKKLIQTIMGFSKEYKCDWIGVFNEDGKADKYWSVNQINEIFSTLHHHMNGAKLVGPDTWGLSAGVQILNKTRILEHIDVVSSHNLGFTHKLWPQFIELAKNKDLLVWDSETNYHDKMGNGTRIESAIAAGVDGIVLYNSWLLIDLETGALKKEAMEIQKLYLK